jgi:hypothetical protein
MNAPLDDPDTVVSSASRFNTGNGSAVATLETNAKANASRSGFTIAKYS